MATFHYIGTAPARPDGSLAFRVRMKNYLVTFQKDENFEVPDEEAFVLQCIRGHVDEHGNKDYEEIIT